MQRFEHNRSLMRCGFFSVISNHMACCYQCTDILSEPLYDAQDCSPGKIRLVPKNAQTAKIEAREKILAKPEKIRARSGSRRPPPPAPGHRQARGKRLPRLSLAAGPSRDTADAGTLTGRSRGHAAAICRAHDAEGLPWPVRRRSGPGGARDPADRRRHHPQPGTLSCDPEDAAPRARPGAAVDADPPWRHPARQMPAARPGAGAAAYGRAV